jgi:hypothetical protein
MTSVIVLVIGIFIGWNVPQPPWAKALQDNVVELARALVRKVSGRP